MYSVETDVWLPLYADIEVTLTLHFPDFQIPHEVVTRWQFDQSNGSIFGNDL
jgi:hypothetical protein